MATEPTLTDKVSAIREYLLDASELILIECMDMVPDQHISSIYDMIQHNRANKVYRSATMLQVTNDVAALVDGKPEDAIYSKPFLKTA